MLLLLPALLLPRMEPAHAGPQNFTIVQRWNAYQLPPDRHAHRVTDYAPGLRWVRIEENITTDGWQDMVTLDNAGGKRHPRFTWASGTGVLLCANVTPSARSVAAVGGGRDRVH